MGICVSYQYVRSIRVDPVINYPADETSRKFWTRKINIIDSSGTTHHIILFSDTTEADLAVVLNEENQK